MDFIVDRKRQQIQQFTLSPKWGKRIFMVSSFFLFTIIIDYVLPHEKINGYVEQTTIYETRRAADTFISLDNESMMLSGIPVSAGDYISIERTPIYNQIINYEIGHELDDYHEKGSYYGHYYGVFCFIPIGLLIAVFSLFIQLRSENFMQPLIATIIFLAITVCMALA